MLAFQERLRYFFLIKRFTQLKEIKSIKFIGLFFFK